ncbi:MAG TPA: DUF192 domain-containing protein [Methanocella sp.]|jgi:hypothetical protein
MAVLKKIDGTVVATDVELADSFLKMTLGLMFRKSIAPGYALVFDMHREQYIGIHMVFVPFSIDLVYLDREKRIVDIKHRLRAWIGLAYPKKRARYAIEMPAGTAAAHGLKEGDVLEW